MSIQTRDVGEIASNSFDFMVKLTRDVGNLLLLIVLNVIPIVNFIVLGYYAKVVKHDYSEPPKLSDYGDLFVEGLKLVIAGLIYAFIPLILLAIGFGAAFIGLLWGGPFGLFRGIYLLLTAFALLLLLFILFFGLPALSIYMRTGDFGKIFAFGEAWDLIQAFGLGNYVVFYILLIVFNAIVAAVGSMIPWVGTAILGVFSMAFTFKALSLLVNLRYPIPPPPPPGAYPPSF